MKKGGLKYIAEQEKINRANNHAELDELFRNPDFSTGGGCSVLSTGTNTNNAPYTVAVVKINPKLCPQV